MDQKKLNEILESHACWLKNEPGGSYADLRGAKHVPYIPMACPDTGEFIAWKKAYSKDGIPCLVKLCIPKNARRSSATGRKCRADKAVVLSIEYIAAKGAGSKSSIQ